MSNSQQALLQGLSYQAIEIDQQHQCQRTISEDDIQLFAVLSGDLNPVHIDSSYAAQTAFEKPIAHGMLTNALISAAIAMHLPGPGSIYRSQSIKFSKPVFIGDCLSLCLTVTAKNDRSKCITLKCEMVNQHGKKVAAGEAEVIAPTEAVSVAAATPAKVCIDQRDYQHL